MTSAAPITTANSPQRPALHIVLVLIVCSEPDPQPELHLQPEPEAPYETVNEVFVAANRAKVKRMGFVGNESYGRF